MSKTFAQIVNGLVANTLVAETKEDAEFATGSECVEYSLENPASIGWFYDSTTGLFSEPIIEEVIEQPLEITN